MISNPRKSADGGISLADAALAFNKKRNALSVSECAESFQGRPELFMAMNLGLGWEKRDHS